VLRSIGSQTLPIYLAHTPIIVLTAVVLHTLGLMGHPLDVALPPLLVAFAIWVALRLRAVAVRVGCGFLYAPPAWFFPPQPTVAPAPQGAPAAKSSPPPG